MTKLLFPMLFVFVACGGKAIDIDPVNDGAVDSNAGDGREPLSDGGLLHYDAAGETRSDCAFVVGQAACESRADAYCNTFVPCFLASGKTAANNGEHYDSIDQCLSVVKQFCDVPDWHVAICESNLAVCTTKLKETSCSDYMQETITLPGSCDPNGELGAAPVH